LNTKVNESKIKYWPYASLPIIRCTPASITKTETGLIKRFNNSDKARLEKKSLLHTYKGMAI